MKLFVCLLIVSLSCLDATALPLPDESCGCLSRTAKDASQRQQVKAELKRSNAVFSGKVVQIVKKEAGFFKGNLEVTFEISESWKRVKGRTISILTQAQVTATAPPYVINCGYKFEVGESYLVYVESISGSGEMLTGSCSRTKKLDDAAADVKVLGVGKTAVKAK